MTIDLENRLVRYRSTLDDAIELDRERPHDRVATGPSRMVILASAAAVLAGVAGVVAVSTLDRADRDVPTAESPVSGVEVSPTEGVLPRLLPDPADGWEPVRIEDYLLADTEGAYSRIDYERTTYDGTVQIVSVTVRRTREQIRIAEAQRVGDEPCDARRLDFGERTGYSMGDGFDDTTVMWNFDDHVLIRVMARRIPSEAMTSLALGLASASEAAWVAAVESIDPDAVVSDPAGVGATFQQWWPGLYVYSVTVDPPTPDALTVTIPSDVASGGNWVWEFSVCVADPSQ